MNEPDIDIRSFVGLIQRQLRLILTTVLVVLSLAGLYAFLQTPIYTASTLVLVDPRQKNILEPEIQMSAAADNARVESELEILRAASTLLAVISDEHLVADEEFGIRLGWRDKITALIGTDLRDWLAGTAGNDQTSEASDPSGELQRVLNRFSKAVSISRRGLTYLISISVSSEDPRKAARLANVLAESYIRQQLEAKVASMVGARDALSRRLDRAAAEINDVEARIDDFVSSNLDAIANDSTRSDLALLRARLESLSERSEASVGLASTVNDLAAKRDWATLADRLESQTVAVLEKRRQELAARFESASAGSAIAIDLRSQLAQLELELSETVGDQLDRLRGQAASAQAEEDRIRDEIRKTLMETELPNATVVRLFQLQQEADVTRNQYQGLLERLREVEAQSELQLPDSRVVSPATPPASSTSPKILLILAVSGAASLGLGFGLAFLTENYVGGFGSLDQAEAVLSVPAVALLPLLASAPRSDGGRSTVVDDIVRTPLSAYSEAVRRVRLGVETLNKSHGRVDTGPIRQGLVVMIASAVPREGKTTTAVSLGRAFALAGQRTLLIDCDLRQPNVGAALGLQSGSGLLDFLLERPERSRIAQSLCVDDSTGLQVLLGGRRSNTPTDTLLSSDRFSKLMEVAREAFDVIILDTPPVLPVTDAQYVVRHADCVVLTAKWSSTPQRAVAAALKTLRGSAASGPTYAVVLTQAEIIGSSYTAKYGSYYSTAA